MQIPRTNETKDKNHIPVSLNAGGTLEKPCAKDGYWEARKCLNRIFRYYKLELSFTRVVWQLKTQENSPKGNDRSPESHYKSIGTF